MVSYHKPEHINFLFNTDEFNSSLSTTLTLQDANNIFLSKSGSSTVSAYINWIETQTYHSNLDFKDDDNITQLQINKDGINSMSLHDIENCSNLSSNIQLQINDINDIHTDHLDLIQNNSNDISLNLQKINTNINDISNNSSDILNNYNILQTKANINYVDTSISNLIANAPSTMNNLYEISEILSTNTDSIGDIINTIDTQSTTLQNNININSNDISTLENKTQNINHLSYATQITNKLIVGNNTTNNFIINGTLGVGQHGVSMNYDTDTHDCDIKVLRQGINYGKLNLNINSECVIKDLTILNSINNISINELNCLNNCQENINDKFISLDASINTINNTTIPNVDSKTVTNLNAINLINNTTIPNVDSKTVTNLNSIDTINNTTIPNVDSKTVTNLNSIDTINNTTIPNVDSKTVTNLNSINTINNTTIPNVDSKTITNLNSINLINNTTIPNVDSKTVTNLNAINLINNTTIPNVDSKTVTNLNSIDTINNTTIPNVDSKTITNLNSINTINDTIQEITFDSGKTKTQHLKCIGEFEFTQKINNISDTTFNFIANLSSDCQSQINNLQSKTEQIEYDYNYERLILNSDVKFIESATFQNDVRINDIGNQQIAFQYQINNGYIGGSISTANDNLYISSYENKKMGNFIYQIQPRKLILNEYGGDIDLSDINSTINIPGSINNPQINVLENKFNVLKNGDNEINNIKTNNIYTHSFLKSYNIITDGIESVYHQWNEIGDFTIESNINGNIDIQYSFGLRNISPTITINEILIGIVSIRIYGPNGNILITDTTQYDGSENNILPGFTTVKANGFALSLNDYSTGNYTIKAQFTSPQLYNNGSETSNIKIIWNYFNTSSIVITKNVHDDIIKNDDEYLYTSHINTTDIETKTITIQNIYVPMIRAHCIFNYYSGLTMHKSYNLIVTNFPSSEGHFYANFDVNFPDDIFYQIQCEGSQSGTDGYAQSLYFTKFNKTTLQFELKQFTHFDTAVNHSNNDGWTSISVIW